MSDNKALVGGSEGEDALQFYLFYEDGVGGSVEDIDAFAGRNVDSGSVDQKDGDSEGGREFVGLDDG